MRQRKKKDEYIRSYEEYQKKFYPVSSGAENKGKSKYFKLGVMLAKESFDETRRN